MIAARPPGPVHYVSHRLPGAGGAVAHGVAYALGAAGGGEREIVVSVALVEPGALLIVVYLIVDRIDSAAIRYHVVVELDIIHVRVAPVHVCLPVVVDEHAGIDVVPVSSLPYQRLAERVVERPVGRVGHKHAYAVAVYRAVHVELAVALHDARGPGPVVAVEPLEVLERRNRTVVLPVHHVGGSVEQPVLHHEAFGKVVVMRGIEEDSVVVHHRCGVGGVLGLYDRHVQVVVELPPVEVEEFLVASAEKDVEVMHTGDAGGDRSLHHHVVVDYVHADYRSSRHLVEIELYLALILEVQYLQGEQHRLVLAEIHIAQLDPVAVVDRGHIVPCAVKPVELDAP